MMIYVIEIISFVASAMNRLFKLDVSKVNVQNVLTESSSSKLLNAILELSQL